MRLEWIKGECWASVVICALLSAIWVDYRATGMSPKTPNQSAFLYFWFPRLEDRKHRNEFVCVSKQWLPTSGYMRLQSLVGTLNVITLNTYTHLLSSLYRWTVNSKCPTCRLITVLCIVYCGRTLGGGDVEVMQPLIFCNNPRCISKNPIGFLMR